MVDIVTKLNTMMLNGASTEEMIEACASWMVTPMTVAATS